MSDTGNSASLHNVELGSDSNSRGAPRRSRVACRPCNHRKVRCDVTRTGIPCSNCRHENAQCEVLPRKKHRPRRSRTASTQKDRGDEQSYRSTPGRASRNAADRQNPQDSRLNRSVTYTQHGDEVPRGARRESSLGVNHSNLLGESSKILAPQAEPEEVLPDDNSLSYIGDKRGARFFVYDLCHPKAPQDEIPSQSRRPSNSAWKPHEIEYLRCEGAFDTLPEDIYDDMIRCYFHHVHFFLPVVDAASFLTEYTNSGLKNINLLLFWSMLLAAANFVGPDTLQRSGCPSRKALKVSMYKRAKSLYDLDRGTDKLILIQSVMLMGFWYSDPQEHTGASYWIGIAITLSQTLGLHRSSRLNSRSLRPLDAQQPLIRRIWWSCIVRDRWLSLAKGRPMRIHEEDCDITMPRFEDVVTELDAIGYPIREKFIPSDSEMLAKMWISLVEISATLGRILRIHYRVDGPKPTVEDINSSARDLQFCKPRDILGDSSSVLAKLHAYHVELFYEATVAVLYRPYVFNEPTFQVQSSWTNMALEQARAAASNTNKILEKIIELDAIQLLKPMMITTLIPAMQIHLFDCKSTVGLRRGLGNNKLNLCMLALTQLRDTYWSASVIYRLFARAQNILDQSSSSTPLQAEKSTGSHRNGEGFPGNHVSEQSQAQGVATEDVSQVRSESDLLIDDQVVPFWMNDSPCFDNVDQLLSPGFSISENAFQSLFIGYNNSIEGVYDQIIPAPGDIGADMLL